MIRRNSTTRDWSTLNPKSTLITLSALLFSIETSTSVVYPQFAALFGGFLKGQRTGFLLGPE